jgi:monofunctional biosynthetic peptidoglycan transglycosylase
VVPPVSTLMLARWATGAPVDRRFVPLTAISPHLVRAVVASEDQSFCDHGGVDWPVLVAETSRHFSGERSFGASTIPMQVTKNLFLWPSRSTLRKAIEVPLALGVDLVWSKRRMLEVYLNIAEWGPGIFGAEAAAQRHFRKSAAALTLKEAALLATALPNPILRNPAKPSRGHQRRARIIMERQAAGGDWLKCLGGAGS